MNGKFVLIYYYANRFLYFYDTIKGTVLKHDQLH